jgi:hypothetical protein
MLLVPLGLALLVSRVNNVKRHLILVSILVFGSAAIASATNIPIANFSFESPVVATQHSSISGAPPSWTGTTVNGFGVFAPDPAELAPPTDGRQVGFENTGSTLSQELTATLTANTTYTLNVDFLSRIDCCDWAGGTILLETHDRTILGETTLSTLAPGAVQTATVTYTALAGNLLLGQALVVEIDSSHNGNAGSSQIDFDNVRLGATTPSGAPEPGNFSLAATGVLLLAATWAFASRQSGFTS